jgi:predicted flap endonuclease-1-like 5' DNA nuclease
VLHQWTGWLGSQGGTPALFGFGSGLAQETEGQGVPWYVWLLIILVLLLFAVFVYQWWVRSRQEEQSAAVHEPKAPAAPPRAVEAKAPPAEAALAEPVAAGVLLAAAPEASVEAETPVAAVEAVAPEAAMEASAPVLAEAAAPMAATTAAAPVVPDDLKEIEGIGPKIESVLNAAGIQTFAQLAAADLDQIRAVLAAADPRLLKITDPATWPEQALLASKGDLDGLRRLQDTLKGGRRLR